jgi:hypothetical protein
VQVILLVARGALALLTFASVSIASTGAFASEAVTQPLQSTKNQTCALTDKRACPILDTISSILGGHRMTPLEGTTLAGRMAEFEWVIGAEDYLHIGETRQLSEDELFFLLAHEYAHSILRHGREILELFSPPKDRGLPDRELFALHGKSVDLQNYKLRAKFHEHEFAADLIAAMVMQSAGVNALQAMPGVLRNRSGDLHHPPRRARIEAIAAAAKND